jgi:hypothetical protein
MILIAPYIHAASPHLYDFRGVAKKGFGGTTNQKVASSSLAGAHHKAFSRFISTTLKPRRQHSPLVPPAMP